MYDKFIKIVNITDISVKYINQVKCSESPQCANQQIKTSRSTVYMIYVYS